VTLGTGIAIVSTIAALGGFAMKAKHDIEMANDKQDSAIKRLDERDLENREMLKEIRADVKKLLGKTP
jgi:succinate dehydrogenase/fumarate reductase flavoprotein subunit